MSEESKEKEEPDEDGGGDCSIGLRKDSCRRGMVRGKRLGVRAWGKR